MSCAKMTEPIDLPFGLWTQVGLKGAQEKSYSPTEANVPSWEDTFAHRPSAAAMWPYVKLL